MAHFTEISKQDLSKAYGFVHLKDAVLLETAGQNAGLAVVHIRTLLDREKDEASEKLRIAIVDAQLSAHAIISAALKQYDQRFQ